MISFLLVALMGLLDRVRGNPDWAFISGPGNTQLERAAMGLTAVGLIFVVSGPINLLASLAIIAGMALGAAPGWGGAYALASNQKGIPDGWQVGILRRSGPLALWARGVIWGICFIPAGLIDGRAALVGIAYTVAFPVSFYAVYKYAGKFTGKEWAQMEWIRGWLAGLILLGGLLITGGTS